MRQLEHAFVAQIDPSARRRDDHRAGAGRGRVHPVPPRFLRADPRAVRPTRHRHDRRRGADAGSAAPARLFAIEHYGVVPDLVVTAKSLGAGMPISAVTGRAEIMDAAHLGGVGGTYGGSPVACAAAIEAVEIIRQPAFLAHARRLGDVMREVMNGWKARSPMVGDVRGLGPMMLAELVQAIARRRNPRAEETLQIVRQAVARRRRSSCAPASTATASGCCRRSTMPEDMLREGLARNRARHRDVDATPAGSRRARDDAGCSTSSSTTAVLTQAARQPADARHWRAGGPNRAVGRDRMTSSPRRGRPRGVSISPGGRSCPGSTMPTRTSGRSATC